MSRRGQSTFPGGRTACSLRLRRSSDSQSGLVVLRRCSCSEPAPGSMSPSARPRRSGARRRSRPASSRSSCVEMSRRKCRTGAPRRPRSRSGSRPRSMSLRGGRPRSSAASRVSPTARRTSSSCRTSSRRPRTTRSTQLERVAGLTVAEAKHHLLERSQDLIRHELARSVRQQEEEARTESRRRARALIADALQRVAASHTAETTVTVVELPVGRHEGPHHRPRGQEHPRARAPDRRRLHHRRHAAGRRPLLVRRAAPRGGAHDAREADRGRPHPPGADRGDVLPLEG